MILACIDQGYLATKLIGQLYCVDIFVKLDRLVLSPNNMDPKSVPNPSL